MKPFLEKIADRLMLKFPDNMDEIAVVLPSKRSVVFLKYYLSQKITKPVFLPKFFSIEEFIEDISDLKVVDNISLQFYLYQSYLVSSIKKHDSFNDFLNWSSMLLYDFNDIDTNIVDAKSLYGNLKNVKELENWNIDNWSFSETPLTNVQENYMDFFESLFSVYQIFKKDLLDKKMGYQGLANRVAAEKISTIELPWKKVWFVGLNALTSSEHVIIDNLKQRDIARVFWDADEYYFKNNDHEAGLFLKQQQTKWSEIEFEGVGDYFSISKDKFNIVACPQNIAQAQVMSQVLSQIKKSDLNNSNTAIILADENLLYPVLNHIPDSVENLNVTMGSPIKNTPFFAFINTFLLMKLSVLKYKKNKFYFKDLFLFIDDPYFKKIVAPNSIRNLKKYIYSNNIVFVSSEEINDFLDKKIQVLFSLTINFENTIKQLKYLISLLRVSLVNSKATIDSEILNVFHNSICMLEKLFTDFTYQVDLRTLITIIKQLVSKEIIPFKGEPLEGVQLMGILESRALDFKNIIMLGVNEGFLPKSKGSNSFIPFDLKKYFKIPTHNERDAVFSYHFYRILQRANNITLTYSTKIDDFSFGEKSRFITQLLSEYSSGEIKEYTYKDNNFTIPSQSSCIIPNKGLEKEIRNWAKNGVSPSALNKYNKCSLDFYYHYLVKIRETVIVDEFADNSLMGSAIHHALDKNYPIGNLYLANFHEQQMSIFHLVINSLHKYYRDKLSENNFYEGKNYLSIKVAQKLATNFLRHEKSLLTQKGSSIEILYKEQEMSHDLKVEGFNFRLKGIVDRVDKYNGTLRIIDYKSGKAVTSKDLNFQKWDDIIDDPKKDKLFQVMMYAYLFLNSHPEYVNTDVVAGIFSFRNLDNGLIHASHSSNLLFNNDTLDNFEQQLIRLLKRIIEKDFSANKDPKICEFCSHTMISN